MARSFATPICIAIVTACAMLPPTRAAADDSALVICRVITDRAAELIRIGEVAKARAMKPQLQECIRVQRAEQDRAARQLVHDYDAAVVKPSPW